MSLFNLILQDDGLFWSILAEGLALGGHRFEHFEPGELDVLVLVLGHWSRYCDRIFGLFLLLAGPRQIYYLDAVLILGLNHLCLPNLLRLALSHCNFDLPLAVSLLLLLRLADGLLELHAG